MDFVRFKIGSNWCSTFCPFPDNLAKWEIVAKILEECALDCEDLKPEECRRKETKMCWAKCECYRTSVEQGAETEDFDGFEQNDVLEACSYVKEMKEMMPKEKKMFKIKILAKEQGMLILKLVRLSFC